MNIFANLTKGSKNLHVSIPIFIAIGCDVAAIWLPQYETQLKATQKVLFGYGILSASTTGNLETPKDSATK